MYSAIEYPLSKNEFKIICYLYSNVPEKFIAYQREEITHFEENHCATHNTGNL